MSKNYKLYVENEAEWDKSCAKDALIDTPLKVRTVENGYILPSKKLKSHLASGGGVCDSDGNFVAGHIRSQNAIERVGNVCFAYPVSSELPYIKETVVFSGHITNGFGHVALDNLSRMWWFLQNKNCEYKFVFISNKRTIEYIEFFHMLGLSEENIILLNEPTRFDKIIVPDQASFPYRGYHTEALSVYNAIRDSVTPAGFEKIYITRTKLAQKQAINEEYFEDYYRSLGYEIIAMETLPLREQIAILAGAKDVVTSSGAAHMALVFCQDGVNMTILNRTRTCWNRFGETMIFQIRSAHCTFIDVSVNILPTTWVRGCQLFMPTEYWKRYVEDCGHGPVLECSLCEIALEYIGAWVTATARQEKPRHLKEMKKNAEEFSLADTVISVNTLLGHDLDDATKKRLRNAFPSLKSVEKKKLSAGDYQHD